MPDDTDEELWYFHSILNSKIEDGVLKYKVKWPRPYSPSWEPATNLRGNDEEIARFHEKHPRKPGPPDWWSPPEPNKH